MKIVEIDDEYQRNQIIAGSGTTAHAVNLLNSEDNGNRRCIMITNNEVSENETSILSNKGLKPGDIDWENNGVARYIT